MQTRWPLIGAHFVDLPSLKNAGFWPNFVTKMMEVSLGNDGKRRSKSYIFNLQRCEHFQFWNTLISVETSKWLLPFDNIIKQDQII